MGTTRVFSLSLPPAQARALRKSREAQFAILGVEELNVAGLEVFPLSDIEEIGLGGYLREGTDAHVDDIKRDGAKLAALDGWVMLVHSLAFGGVPSAIVPDSALTLIGTYAQTPSVTQHIDITAEAAQPYTGVPNTPATVAERRGSGSLVVVILVAISGFILWWALT